MAEVEDEKKEKRVLIAKLEEAVTEKQQFAIQINRIEQEFSLTAAARAQEVEQLRADSQRDKYVYERRKNELVQESDDLNKQVAAMEEKAANFKEKAETEIEAKLELLKTVTEDQKNKEKMLEILANEKFSVEDQLAHEKNRLAALAQNLDIKEEELTHAKRNRDRLAAELQDAYERLDTAIADTANLSDEVMAKTAQVKQYNKQTESYKAKVEETNSELQQTQHELQQRHRETDSMELSYQSQVN